MKEGRLIEIPKHVEEIRKAAELNEKDPYRDFRRVWCHRLDVIKERFLDGVIKPWDETKVPTPPVSIEDLRNYRYLASYHIVPDGYGINDKLTLNEQHVILKDGVHTWDLGERALAETIFHEVAHEKIQRTSKDPYDPKNPRSETHSKEFRALLLSWGIHCNARGQHTKPCDPGSSVDLLCDEWGLAKVEIPEGLELPGNLDWFKFLFDPEKKRKGTSTLAKWSCGCQNARIGAKEFDATCLRCGNVFVKEGVNQTVYQTEPDLDDEIKRRQMEEGYQDDYEDLTAYLEPYQNDSGDLFDIHE